MSSIHIYLKLLVMLLEDLLLSVQVTASIQAALSHNRTKIATNSTQILHFLPRIDRDFIHLWTQKNLRP